MKEKLTIIIKISLEKRQIDYKKGNGLQSLEIEALVKNNNNNNNKKTKKQTNKQKRDKLWLQFLLQVCPLQSW